MSDPIAISTATQGAGHAATTQAGGKASGFLGMLMAAIGDKTAGTAKAANIQAKAAENEAHALTGKTTPIGVATKISKGKLVLMAMTGDGSAQGAKGKAGITIAAMAQASQGFAQANSTRTGHTAKDTIGSLAEDAQATKGQATSLLIGKAATAAAGKHQEAVALLTMAEGDTAATKSAKDGQAAMSKHHDAKSGQHQGDGQAGAMSGTAGTTPPASILQAAATMTPVQPVSQDGAQTGTDARGGKSQAQGRASMPMQGRPDIAAPSESPSPAPEIQAMADNASSETAKMAKPAVSAPSTPTHATTIAAAGAQIQEQQYGKDRTKVTAKGQDTGAMASAGRAAKAGQGPMGMSAIQTHAHPQDAVAANSHVGASDIPASDTSGNASTRTPLPQTGIQSYSQAVGEHARQLPSQATLTPARDPASGPRTDMSAGPASSPGQDPTAANMALTANAGIGTSTQAMATPQTATPQAPVHASGPWTAMAAMVEIGQAAANGQTRLELKLEPAHLGKVHVRIDSDSRKNIQVHLVVEQPNSRQIIEQQLPNLRHAMEQQGLNLGNFSMSSQQQGNGQGSGQPQPQTTATVGTSSFNTAPASTPQISHAPAEPMGTGRLSIRI